MYKIYQRYRYQNRQLRIEWCVTYNYLPQSLRNHIAERHKAVSLTVHHLSVSQSDRIPWLCEELGIQYVLKTYKRVNGMAPLEYKAQHPSQSAPVIQDGDSDGYSVTTLAESCACVEYICRRHGGGRLFLEPAHAAYADFLYWWH
ncbi:hypothetical protein MGN70_000329 [Eutypa lata]|nr:hypothetical protein MGN70_000329 [Eutypa lata]